MPPLTDIEQSLITGEDLLPRTLPPSKHWRAVWGQCSDIDKGTSITPWYDVLPPQWFDYVQGLVLAGPICPSAEIAEELARKRLTAVLGLYPEWPVRPLEFIEVTPEGDPIA